MIKHYILLVLYILITIPTIATQQTDSLVKTLNNLESLRVDSPQQYIKTVEKEIEKSNDPLSQIIAYGYILTTNRNIGNYISARQCLDSIVSLKNDVLVLQSKSDSIYMADALNNVSAYFSDQHKFTKSLDYLKEAIELVDSYPTFKKRAYYYQNNALLMLRLGQVESGLESANKALTNYRNNNDYDGMSQCASLIGATMTDYRNYDLASKYFDLALSVKDSLIEPNSEIALLNDIGRMYNYKEQYDSSLVYFLKSYKLSKDKNTPYLTAISGSNIGETYIKLEQWDSAIPVLKQSLELFTDFGVNVGVCQENSLLAFAYHKKRETTKANSFQKKAEELIHSIEMYPQLLSDYYQRTYEIKYKQGNYQEAFENLNLYTKLKDSLNNVLTTWKVNDLETRLMTNMKEQQLTETENKLLIEKENKFRIVLWGISILSFLLILLWFLLYRRQKEKHLHRVQQDLLVQEHEKGVLQMQLLMARNKLSPHLMANIFLDVRNSIEQEEKQKSIEVLDNVSNIVINSYNYTDSINVNLNEEIEFVKSYIEIRKPILGNNFSYSIETDDDSSEIQVPSLIIQLFVENAIKHGLFNKADNKELRISAYKKGFFLVIEVEDNGIGRQKAKELGTSGTGMGLVILEKVILYLNEKNELPIKWSINDLANENNQSTGTLVKITIPANYNY